MKVSPWMVTLNDGTVAQVRPVTVRERIALAEAFAEKEVARAAGDGTRVAAQDAPHAAAGRPDLVHHLRRDAGGGVVVEVIHFFRGRLAHRRRETEADKKTLPR